MADDREQYVERLFQRALELPPEERGPFLERECGDDEALRQEIESLLRHAPLQGETALARPLMRLGPAARRITDPESVGPYRILQRLGEGGFGVVYEVEQTEPLRRRLALKLLKAGMDTEEVLARFEAERQALALMEHPGISRVIDAGATEQGRPYFVMELVRGDPVTDYCDRERLSIRERLDLFLSICRAVQHAHQKGVLHRDLKPTNILVTEIDGKPVPKVIDFGIAKATGSPLTQRTLHTLGGQIVGTPVYISPEQAGRSRLDVDTATDVYSLGVILYELLSGRLPYDPDAFRTATPHNYEDVLRDLDTSPPSRHFTRVSEENQAIARRREADPSRLSQQLTGDLDWIVMRAIERDRTRRYQTVLDLIQEVERHLRDEPVVAGPPGIRYRVAKFARRHRVGLIVASTILIGLIATTTSLTWALLQSNRQRAQAEAARRESEAVLDFMSNMLAAARPMAEGQDATLVEVLDTAAHNVARDFADQPLVEARLRSVIGSSYRELGKFEAAREQLDRSLAIRQAELGPDHDLTLLASSELGLLERNEGHYDRAEAIMRDVLLRRRQRFGKEARGTISAMRDLSSVYVLAERTGEAIAIGEEADRIARRALDPDDPLHGAINSDLANAYQAVGRYDEAEERLWKLLELDERQYGLAHVQTIAAQLNLAALYRELSRYEEAEPLYRNAYEAARKVYGEEHPSTLRTRSNLALLLSDMGQYAEALEHSRLVVEARERTMGADNPGTLVSQINLALLYLRMERYEDCVASARETSQRCRRVVGPDHLYTLSVEATLGSALHHGGDPRQAEPILRSVVERSRKSFPEGHWRTGRIMAYHGACLTDLERYEEAEALLLEGHESLAATYGEEHERVRDTARELARLYTRWKRPVDAREWMARAQ